MSRGAMVRSQESSDAATRHTPRRAVVGTGHGAAGQAGDQPGVERGFADATAAGCHGDLTERHPVLPRPADRADLDLGYRGSRTTRPVTTDEVSAGVYAYPHA
jgi:hypothetical protein